LTAVILAVSPAVTAFNPHPPCTSVNLTTNPYQNTTNGNTVTLTASTTGCNQPAEYQFFIQAPGHSWVAQGGYSTTNTFAWSTSGLLTGTYGIGVHARAAGTTVAYDVYYLGSYILWYGHCEGVPFTAGAGPSAVVPGTVIHFDANSGCNNTPEFRYLVQPPGGAFRTVRGYSTTSSFDWDTTGLTVGVWHVAVWVRQVGNRASYDAYNVVQVVLDVQKCIYMAAATSYSSPQAAGAIVTISASAFGCGPIEYEFWIQAPGGAFTIVQGYSTVSGYGWDTAALANGRYQISVWARQQGSSRRYDVYTNMSYYIGS
jgi:hypothetical protein